MISAQCRVAAASLLAIFLLDGCAHLPPPPPTPPPAPAIRKSIAIVPLTVSLEPARQYVESLIPVVDDGWNAYACDDRWFKYEHYERRDPIGMSANANAIATNVRIHYALRGCITPSGQCGPCGPGGQCGDAGSNQLLNAYVHLNTSFAFSPDWSVDAHTDVPIINMDNCNVTLANYNLSGKITDRLTRYLHDKLGVLDQKIKSESQAILRPDATKVWAALCAPIPLQKGLWLSISPSAIGVSPLEGSGSTVGITAQVEFQPKLYLATPPPPTPPSPLPDLGTVSGDPGISIMTIGEAPLRAANDSLKLWFKGKSFETGHVHFRLNWVELSGMARLAVMAFGFSGTFHGTAYLYGKPRYDKASNEVVIDSLDYAVDAHPLPAQVLAALFHAKIREAIAERAHWKIGAGIDDVKRALIAALNKDYNGVELIGKDIDVTPDWVWFTPDAMQVAADMSGKLEVRIDKSWVRGITRRP